MNIDDERAQTDDDAGAAGGISEAEIDRTLADTFPASDPPSWTLGTNHQARTREEPETGEREDD